MSNGALSGLVVLDLTQMLAGPYATMMLADQGARIVKVEPPGGDNTRRIGPHPEGGLKKEQGGYGAYFGSINRNKESIVLDLKNPAGKALFLRMVEKVDVVAENYRAGVMERLGLGFEYLTKINPRLVYATLRGFGDPRSGRTPYTDWPAYDPVAQAMGGIMAITGTVQGGTPTKVGPGVGDLVPAMFLAFGIASACWSALRTGKGQFLDVAMVDAVLALCERTVFQYSVTGAAPGVEGNGHPLLCPFGLFPAKDGYVSVAISRDEFWAPFVERIGRAELASDPCYATNELRVKHRPEVDALVTEWTRARTKKEIAAALGGEIPFGPVFSAADVFQDQHFRARDMLAEVEHPGAGKKQRIAGTPLKMQGTPGGVRRRAPLAGEHTDTILSDFGLSSSEIRTLRDKKVVA